MRKCLLLLILIAYLVTSVFNIGVFCVEVAQLVNLGIDGSSQRSPIIKLYTMNATGADTVKGIMLLNDGLTPVGQIENTVFISSNPTDMRINIPYTVLPGEYIFRISSSTLSSNIPMDLKYIISPPSGQEPNVQSDIQNMNAGTTQNVNVQVSMNVSNYTEGEVSFVNASNTVVSSVTAKKSSFMNGVAGFEMSIPANIAMGEYKFKAKVFNTIKYSSFSVTNPVIDSSGPTISNVSSTGASLTEESISGNIVISGTNFASQAVQNQVEIIKSSDNERFGNLITPLSSTSEAISFLIPSNIIAGNYKVKVIVNGRSAISTQEISIATPSNLVITPTPTISVVNPNTPSIGQLSFSTGSNTRTGEISGNLLISLIGFTQKPQSDTAYILNSSNQQIAIVNLDASSSVERLVAPIPQSLQVGNYKVKIIVDSVEYISSNGFTINAQSNTTTPTPTISGALSMGTVPDSNLNAAGNLTFTPITGIGGIVSNIPAFNITGLDVSNTVLLEGKISGNIIIKGNGFISVPSAVEFIDGDNKISGAEMPLSFTVSTIISKVPTNLSKGDYKVRINIMGNSAISTQTFVVEAQSSTIGIIEGVEEPNKKGQDELENFQSSVEIKDIQRMKDDKNNKMINIVSIENIMKTYSDYHKAKKSDILLTMEEGSHKRDEIILNSEVLSFIRSLKAGVVIKKNAIEVRLSNEALTKIGEPVNKLIFETFDEEKIKRLNEAKEVINSDIKGVLPYFDISLSGAITNKPIDIKNLEDKITIKFDLRGMEKNKFNIKKLGLYYFDHKVNGWSYIGGKFDKNTGSFIGETNHLSIFGLFESTKRFEDIDENTQWAREYIEVLTAKNIVKGIDDKNFMPLSNVKRSEFATLIVKSLDIQLQGYEGFFKDVNPNSWFAKFVEAAYRNDILSGTGNGYFNPDGIITHEEVIVMLMRAYQKRSQKVFSSNDKKLNFSDFDSIAPWAKQHIFNAISTGIIDGNEKSFMPKVKASRATTAKHIYMLLNSIDLL